jgi:glutamate/tyrosine decarboxylase-like PLP-dependent enzyme
MAPPPASTLFFRDTSFLDHAKAICPPNGTISGTRGTGPIAGAWAMIKLLGEPGFVSVAQKSIALRDALLEGVRAIDGLSVYPGSRINMALIYSEELDLGPVDAALRERGWMYAAQPVPPAVSIVLVTMPHNDGQVDPLLEDLHDTIGLAVPLGSGADELAAAPDASYGL